VSKRVVRSKRLIERLFSISGHDPLNPVSGIGQRQDRRSSHRSSMIATHDLPPLETLKNFVLDIM
jgi:hypothetical protein